MQVYVNNIVKDPDSQKYRKIRITNPKFNSAIWQLEQARTFLLLSGFEQVHLQYTYWYESHWGATWGGLEWFS